MTQDPDSVDEEILRLQDRLEREILKVRKLEADSRTLKREKSELLNFINETKKPSTHAYVVVEPREEDVLLYGLQGLQTAAYGRVDKEQVTPGRYVLVGNIHIDLPSYPSYRTKYSQTPNLVPGVVEVLDREAPLLRGKVITIDYGKDYDIVIMSTDPHYQRSLKLAKGKAEELGLKPNMSIDCLPETLDIIRVSKSVDVAKYEVIERPKISFDDIGGLKDAKMEVVTSVLAPMINKRDYAKFGKRSTKVLLYGPPGCGKTMLAQALANTLKDCGFYRVNAAEIHEMWVGKSEENLRNIFKTAIKELEDKRFKYMVLFFDEIDALAPHRGLHPGSSGVEEKVVGELLTWLEGFRPLPSNILVVGATNMPGLVDSAVRQRFDRLIEVSQPRDKATVIEIISRYIKSEKVPIDKNLLDSFGDEACKVLSEEFSEFLFRDEYIELKGTRINRKDIITGRLISQTVENAKELALYDRTILRENIPKRYKEIFESIGSREQVVGLSLKYKSPEDIGINMEYLKAAFEMNEFERAEEIVSSQQIYLSDKRKEPQWAGLSYYS
ncbi:MAG: AAA family ATPase [Halobacteriota archaeon]|nr:AAA family ATPase [Halobacteriota archaeon]